ncbi:hypothetical protein Hanom_Chr03g00249341 [Helianthus anomalus]
MKIFLLFNVFPFPLPLKKIMLPLLNSPTRLWLKKKMFELCVITRKRNLVI